MSDYFSLLTMRGLEKLAIAAANGATIELSEMAFSNSTTEITGTETVLAGEMFRVALSRVGAEDEIVSCEAIIPVDVGGFWIRKAAVFDSDGELLAIGKYPATYKPAMSDGAVKELCLKMILAVSNAPDVVITFNNSIIAGANTNLDNLTFAGQKKFDDKADLAEMTAALAEKENTADVDAKLADKANKTGDTIAVASANPTTTFSVRNIKAQTEDPGVDSALATGDILLVYEE
jgi:phage-related tail fiber protein